ncbi:MAG: 30S ribosomal protein S19e [Candidatus Diapherotrites archaeon]|nr:30S ribosomal protein S19e [Candidatus Diapherotrites archaeon]
MGILDVPASELIQDLKEDLKTKGLNQPRFIDYVKSGAHAERAPLQRDWWFMRCASILYRIYREGPLGTESLRTYYGGKKARGVRPHRFTKAGGKVIRTCLQALEKNQFVKKEKKGRILTPAGQKYLNTISKKTLERIQREGPEKKVKREEKTTVSAEEKTIREALRRQSEGGKPKEDAASRDDKKKQKLKEGTQAQNA